MKVFKSWFKRKGKHLLDALLLLLFTIVGGTMPLWGGALLVRLSNQWESWSSFCFSENLPFTVLHCLLLFYM